MLLLCISAILCLGVRGDNPALTNFLNSLGAIPTPTPSVLTVTPQSASDYQVQWPSSPSAASFNVSVLRADGSMQTTFLTSTTSAIISNLSPSSSLTVTVTAPGIAYSAAITTPSVVTVATNGSWSSSSLWSTTATPCGAAVVLFAPTPPLPSPSLSPGPFSVDLSDTVAVRGLQFSQPGAGITLSGGGGIYLLSDTQGAAAASYPGLPSCTPPLIATTTTSAPTLTDASTSSSSSLPIIPIAAAAGGGILLILLIVLLVVRRRRRARLQDTPAKPTGESPAVTAAWNQDVYFTDGSKKSEWGSDYGGAGHVVNGSFQGEPSYASGDGNQMYSTLDSSTDADNIYSVVGEGGEALTIRPRAATASKAGEYHTPPVADHMYDDVTMMNKSLTRRQTVFDKPTPQRDATTGDVVYELVPNEREDAGAGGSAGGSAGRSGGGGGGGSAYATIGGAGAGGVTYDLASTHTASGGVYAEGGNTPLGSHYGFVGPAASSSSSSSSPRYDIASGGGERGGVYGVASRRATLREMTAGDSTLDESAM